MNKALAAILALLVLGCQIVESNNRPGAIQLDIDRDLTTLYDEEEGYGDGADWITLQEARTYMRSSSNPKIFVATVPECLLSFKVHRDVGTLGVKDRLRFINMQEEWVMLSTIAMQIDRTPTLLVFFDKDTGRSYKVNGHDKILRHIEKWTVEKNPQ